MPCRTCGRSMRRRTGTTKGTKCTRVQAYAHDRLLGRYENQTRDKCYRSIKLFKSEAASRSVVRNAIRETYTVINVSNMLSMIYVFLKQASIGVSLNIASTATCARCAREAIMSFRGRIYTAISSNLM